MSHTINNTAIIPSWMSPEEKTMEIVRNTLEGVAYAANLLFGLPINGYVLRLITSGTREKIAYDLIPLNQVVVEILLSVSGMWYFLKEYLSGYIFTNIFSLLSIMFLIMRPLVQTCICLEQYLATVHPVIFLRCKPLRYRVTGCCVSWLTVMTMSSVGAAFNLHWWFSLMIAVLYQVFLLLMAFCCFSVLSTLKRPGPGDGRKDQQRGNSIKKRAFNLILINLVYTFLSQLPLAISGSLLGVIPKHIYFTLASINVCIFVMTGFVPPVLYLYRVGKLCSKCNCL